jgi:molybdenum cofactor biosynthesis enzyme MoaA
LLKTQCSLDTLDPFKFELITRRRGHAAVLKTLEMALESKLTSVKLNVVIIRGLNDSEVLDFVEMTKDQPISVRFIEFMPFTGKFPHAAQTTAVELSCR